MNENIEMGIVKSVSWYSRLRDIGLGHSDEVQKIAVITMGVIGDTIMMSPLYRNLRRNYPEAEITVICKSCVRNILEVSPYIDRIVIFDRLTEGKHKFERNVRLIRRMVKENFTHEIFDLVLAPRYLALSLEMLIAELMRARRRVMYTGDIYQPQGVVVSGTGVKCDHWISHVVDRDKFLLEAVGCTIYNDYLETWTTDEDKKNINALWSECGLANGKMKLVVFLSTSAPFKDWPVEKYIAACQEICRRHDKLQLILLGDKKNTESLGCKFCAEITNAVNLIGRTTLRQSIEITRRADLFLGGDTGTLHMSAAAKLYGVVIVKDYAGAHADYGSPMANFGPWQAPIRIARPEHSLPGCEVQCDMMESHCIKQVTVEKVVELMDEAIAERMQLGKLEYMGL